jgi:hypothetical protein
VPSACTVAWDLRCGELLLRTGARLFCSLLQAGPHELNSVYYYFYERTRGVILASRAGSKGLSTLESMLTGLIAGNTPVTLYTTQNSLRNRLGDDSHQ